MPTDLPCTHCGQRRSNHHTKYIPDGIPRCNRGADAMLKYKPLEYTMPRLPIEPRVAEEELDDDPRAGYDFDGSNAPVIGDDLLEEDLGLPKSILQLLKADEKDLHKSRLLQRDRSLMARRTQSVHSRDSVKNQIDDMSNRSVRELRERLESEIVRLDELRAQLVNTRRLVEQAQLPAGKLEEF